MNRGYLLIGIILFFTITTYGTNLRIEGKFDYFFQSEKASRDIYGPGTMYGGEFNIGIRKPIELWVSGMYFNRIAELAITKEETEITLIPIDVGLKFRGYGKTVSGYMGIGVRFYSYKETNPIGEVNENGLGYIGQLGFLIKIMKVLIFDFYINYSHCEVQPKDIKVNIGGFQGGIGLGFEF